MKSSELLRKLKQDGWFVERQTGSHLIMKHPIKQGPVIMPYHGSSEVGKGLANHILKSAGLK